MLKIGNIVRIVTRFFVSLLVAYYISVLSENNVLSPSLFIYSYILLMEFLKKIKTRFKKILWYVQCCTKKL